MCIGKGGAKIQDLQFESGAVIKVTKETEGEETRVRLIGDDEQIKKAEELIKDLTIEKTFYGGPKQTPQASRVSDFQPPQDIASFDWQAINKDCVRALVALVSAK